MGFESRTDADVQIDAAISARNYSQEMSTELERIGRDVSDLLTVWTGGASKAYGDSWTELKEAVQVILDDLDDIGSKVGAAAYTYSDTDSDNSAKLRL